MELHGSELDDDVVATRELCRQLSAGTTLPRARRASMEHYLRFCMDSLREGRAGNVPVFIVLHDFDLFAKRTKQTLLYNLFDITQSSKYQVCIIGTTTRLDATELLEKRLRSRFSQQQILLDQLDLPAYTEFARASLQADPAAILSDASAARFPVKDVGAACVRWNNSCDELVGSMKVTEAVRIAQLSQRQTWCEGNFVRLLQIRRAWRLNRSLRWVQRWLYMAIVELSAASPLLTPDALDAASKAMGDAVEPEVEAVGMIAHLSPCDLTLVIAMCKLEIGRELATYSFEMAYFEYMKHFKAATGAHRQVCACIASFSATCARHPICVGGPPARAAVQVRDVEERGTFGQPGRLESSGYDGLDPVALISRRYTTAVPGGAVIFHALATRSRTRSMTLR